jgi:hypothetical protein
MTRRAISFWPLVAAMLHALDGAECAALVSLVGRHGTAQDAYGVFLEAEARGWASGRADSGSGSGSGSSSEDGGGSGGVSSEGGAVHQGVQQSGGDVRRGDGGACLTAMAWVHDAAGAGEAADRLWAQLHSMAEGSLRSTAPPTFSLLLLVRILRVSVSAFTLNLLLLVRILHVSASPLTLNLVLLVHTPRVSMSIYTEGKSCSDIGTSACSQ